MGRKERSRKLWKIFKGDSRKLPNYDEGGVSKYYRKVIYAFAVNSDILYTFFHSDRLL